MSKKGPILYFTKWDEYSLLYQQKVDFGEGDDKKIVKIPKVF